MDTATLGSVLFGKTRAAVLTVLYGHPEEEFYLRQLARVAGGALGAVQRELQQLAEVGLLTRRQRGRQVFFQANRACPVYPEVKGLLLKTAGVADRLKRALGPLREAIRVAFIYGSLVNGEPGPESDVDVLIVGEVGFGEVVSALRTAQEQLGRDINPSVYRPGEFQHKLASHHHFVSALLSAPKVFLIGDEHELVRLAEKRLAHRASGHKTGDSGPSRRRRTRSGRLPSKSAQR
jgi:uncharacterized protein